MLYKTNLYIDANWNKQKYLKIWYNLTALTEKGIFLTIILPSWGLLYLGSQENIFCFLVMLEPSEFSFSEDSLSDLFFVFFDLISELSFFGDSLSGPFLAFLDLISELFTPNDFFVSYLPIIFYKYQ